ncbi:MAG: hypothetical protein ACOYO1_17400 [Bacteroidales bacterium]
MKNNHRLYYIPGMISLIILPIICICYLKRFHLNDDERTLELAIPCKYNPNDKSELRFDTTLLSQPENKRIYQTFKLNGNKKEDKAKLDSFRLSVRKMLLTEDVKNGVHLLFLDSTNYGSFIEAINICKIEGALIYVSYNDNFWVLTRSGFKELYKKRKKELIKEIKSTNERIDEEKSKKAITPFDCNNLLKFWPVFLVFLILFILSILKLKRTEN